MTANDASRAAGAPSSSFSEQHATLTTLRKHDAHEHSRSWHKIYIRAIATPPPPPHDNRFHTKIRGHTAADGHTSERTQHATLTTSRKHDAQRTFVSTTRNIHTRNRFTTTTTRQSFSHKHIRTHNHRHSNARNMRRLRLRANTTHTNIREHDTTHTHTQSFTATTTRQPFSHKHTRKRKRRHTNPLGSQHIAMLSDHRPLAATHRTISRAHIPAAHHLTRTAKSKEMRRITQTSTRSR